MTLNEILYNTELKRADEASSEVIQLAGQRAGRRNFLRILVAAGYALMFAPFVGFVSFLYRPGGAAQQRQLIANLKEVPPENRLVFPYPRTGDPRLDGDPLRQAILVRLKDGSVKAYSKVCVHLWCLVDFNPTRGEIIDCPCHGSTYNAKTGVAVAGPAFLQPYPTNALPEIKLEIDEDKNVYATELVGRVGYGREYRQQG